MEKKESIFRRAKAFFHAGELTDVIVLSGSDRAVVRGCRKILSYAPQEIRIAQRKQVVHIEGANLRCVSFAAGSTTVEGNIRSVSLARRTQKEEAP